MFFIPTKHNYFKQVEILEVWKKMGEKEEAWVNKVGLLTLLTIEWKELNHDALVKFLNTFVIEGFEIYFGRKNIIYVISKHLIADAFNVC
jgi:hypothetical protein